MNLNLTNLRAFMAVEEQGSFSAGADALHISQPALSRRIANLEAELGVQLFERTTRRVSLTIPGRELSQKARDLLSHLEDSLHGIRDLSAAWKSEVGIACVPSAVRHFLPDVLRRYHANFPNVKVRILDEGAGDCLSRVKHGDVEFGLNYIGAEEVDIEFEPILREPLVLICRRDDPLSGKRAVSWEELAGRSFITVCKAAGMRLLLDLALADLRRRPSWTYEVTHVAMLPALVEERLGVAAIPRMAITDARRLGLVAIPLVDPVVTRTLGLMRKRGRTLSHPGEQLYAMIAQRRPDGPRKLARKTAEGSIG